MLMKLLYHLVALQLPFSPFLPSFSPPLTRDTLPNLETGWGSVQELQVPMLECQRCGHDVIWNSAILEKYERFWLDLDQQVLFGSGFCQMCQG